ncbi:hypothetical protein HPB47_014889, partial [Ixodes persulcatus]
RLARAGATRVSTGGGRNGGGQRNPWELTDDALEPGSRLGRSAAVHATEFRPTGAPRIAAAQEQTVRRPAATKGFRKTEEAADKVIGGETDQRANPRYPIDGVRADGVSSRNSDTHRGPIYFPDGGGKGASPTEVRSGEAWGDHFPVGLWIDDFEGSSA